MKTFIVVMASMFVVCVVASSAPDAVRGKAAFEKRCSGCHGLDQFKEGPMLRRIFGQRSGRIAGFPYSDALKGSHLTWDEQTLDKWLEDPEKLIPDNDMATRVPDATDRASIIAYLKSLRAAHP
jgi:cytochrome c